MNGDTQKLSNFGSTYRCSGDYGILISYRHLRYWDIFSFQFEMFTGYNPHNPHFPHSQSPFYNLNNN